MYLNDAFIIKTMCFDCSIYVFKNTNHAAGKAPNSFKDRLVT